MIVSAEPPAEPEPFRITFVCTGNICRSPMAEAVMHELVAHAGLQRQIEISSAGTGDWHVGEQADQRTLTALSKRGYDASHHRARQFEPINFTEFDLVVVFDRIQERILRSWAPSEYHGAKVRMMLSFDRDQAALGDVPDPYYADDATFDAVLLSIERAASALFRQLALAARASTNTGPHLIVRGARMPHPPALG